MEIPTILLRLAKQVNDRIFYVKFDVFLQKIGNPTFAKTTLIIWTRYYGSETNSGLVPLYHERDDMIMMVINDYYRSPQTDMQALLKLSLDLQALRF